MTAALEGALVPWTWICEADTPASFPKQPRWLSPVGVTSAVGNKQRHQEESQTQPLHSDTIKQALM